MIKFEFGGVEYAMEFEYGHYIPARHLDPLAFRPPRFLPDQRELTKLIFTEDGEVVTRYTVKRYYKDPPNLEQARRILIDRTLADIACGPWQRPFRAVVWQAYFMSNECKQSSRPKQYQQDHDQIQKTNPAGNTTT